MDENEQDATTLAAWCDTVARLLYLQIDRADRHEIIANLSMLKTQMDLVGSFALDDREEPAPHFRA
jgi:1-carboxybiuret hydrolase subunit AtzG-like protein